MTILPIFCTYESYIWSVERCFEVCLERMIFHRNVTNNISACANHIKRRLFAILKSTFVNETLGDLGQF